METLEAHKEAPARRSMKAILTVIGGGAVLFPPIFLVIDGSRVPWFLGFYSAFALLVIIFNLPLALPLIAKYRRPQIDLYGMRGWHRINFVARHWYGEVPLWLSFWLFFIGGSILLTRIAKFAIRVEIVSGMSPTVVLICMVSLVLLSWSFWVWQMVGVLRSADRYKDVRNALLDPELSIDEEELRKREDERDAFMARIGTLPKPQQDFLMQKITERGLKKKTYWATLAQIVVVVATLGRMAIFLNGDMVLLTDTLRIVFRDDPSVPTYSLKILEDGEVRIVGGIKFGLADDLAKILNSRDIRVLRLNSPGGRIREAEKLFQLIRDRQLTTYVSEFGQCFSACTIVFAGGRERIVDRNAVLGFHAGTFAGVSSEESERFQRQIYVTAGFDEKFISRILSTPHSDIWKPSLQELLAAHVVTSVSDKPIN